MSKRLATYDSNQVDLIVVAIPINDGRSDDFCAIDAEEEMFKTESGADGHVCRFKTNARVYKLKIKLKRSSEHNQQLAALHALDSNTPNGAGIGAFLLKDNSGATVLAGGQCWIDKCPAWQHGKAIGDVEWPFTVIGDPITMLFGGN